MLDQSYELLGYDELRTMTQAPRNKYTRLTLSPIQKHKWEKASLIQRFLAQTRKTDSCWIWAGHLNSNGYGMIHVNEFKTDVGAHRVAFMIFRGEIASGMDVCHKCDTPSCVNPDHLFLGTNADNIADSMRKGRSHLKGSPGNLHPQRKLTSQQVMEIKSLKKANMSYKELAKQYAVNKSTIAHIVQGKTWKTLESPN